MSDPYQTPSTLDPPEITSVALWRRALGCLCMLIALPITLYGFWVMALIVIGIPFVGPVTPARIIFLTVMFTSLGLGLGLLGIGLWTGKNKSVRRGSVVLGLSFLGYMSAAVTVV